MDQLYTRAAALEKMSQDNLQKLRDAESAAARFSSPKIAAIRGKLGEIRVAMDEVQRLSGAVVRQAGEVKDPGRRATILAEVGTIEQLQRDVARELNAIEAALKAAPAR